MTLKKFLLCSAIFTSGLAYGMTYDNRFFPLLDKPILHQDNTHCFVRLQPFYMFADRSYNSEGEDRPLFNVFGDYNQSAMDRALVASNKIAGPLVNDMFQIPWSMDGRVDATGLAFRWYYSITDYIDVGGSAFIAGTRSRMQFLLNGEKLKLTAHGRQQLYDKQQTMMQYDHVKGELWDSFGISDLDMYLRLGFMRHYFLKFKTFDLGAKFGLIVPTAKEFNISYPSSLIFGGDKQWGFYFDAALNTELKEDLFAGFNLRFIQRFRNDMRIRLPMNDVPNNLGPVTSTVRVDPGFTFVFGPYGGVANLREGLGLQIGYTLILHTQDFFTDNRTFKPVSFSTDLLSARSKWGAEYITCSAVYDFAKDKECRGATPVVSLDIDIPIHLFVAQQSFKTYGISLRIESDLW